MEHFFLTSNESELFKTPIRKCTILKRLNLGERDDLALIRAEPPYRYIDQNQCFVEIEEFILASRHKGYSIFDIKKWPMDVYISMLKNPLNEAQTDIHNEDIEILAWGEIHLNDPRKV